MNTRYHRSPYSLTPLQVGMFLHNLSEASFGVDIEQIIGTCPENLDASIFLYAWQQVIDKYPILRTGFEETDFAEPVQVVQDEVSLPIEEYDWRSLPPSEQNERLQEYLQSNGERGFNLNQAPLLRLAIFHLKEAQDKVVLTYHRIILDSNSVATVLQEVWQCYQGLKAGKEVELKAIAPYRNYIEWLQQQDISQAETFWKRELQGFSAPTSLTVEGTSRESVTPGTRARAGIVLSEALSAIINSFGVARGLSLETLVQGAWSLLLSRYSREVDVVFAAVTSCRQWSPEAQTMLGMLANTLPVRITVAEDAAVLPWLQSVAETWQRVRDYNYTPFSKIIEWSEVPPGSELAESLVVFEDVPLSDRLPFPVERLYRSSFPLMLVACGGSQLSLQLEYDGQRFDPGAIARMLGHLQTLLEGMVTHPQSQLADLPLLTEAEKQQLLVEWNQTQSDYPRNACIHKLFEEQAAANPDAIAVVFENEQLTYKQLNQQANQLAHHLRSLGVQPETLVGICVERSLDLPVILLGILKAGGAYVPLDPSYPPERLAFMLADTQVAVLIGQRKLLIQLPEHSARVVELERDFETISECSVENPAVAARADNLAYVMYTSGSTGQPKGVSVIHRGVVRLVRNSNYAPFNSDTVFLQLAPIAFDASTLEIWSPLLNGGKVAVMPPHAPSLVELGKAIARHQVTDLWLTAGLFHLAVDEHIAALKPLHRLLAGGDVLSVSHIQRFLEGNPTCQLINGYGPTENTTFTCCHPINSCSADTSIPIGRPIANTTIYILDSHRQPVPIGVPGELYAGGDGLARGYLNRPDLTAERFIPNPFSDDPNAKLYKTGDLVRYLEDGTIEFLGRIDNQVKIRGFRIELGEIESAIAQHPQVRDTTVLAREDRPGDKQLVAYFVPQEGETLTGTELRHWLRDKLPGYMIPAAFVELAEFPLNPNGKIDRRALSAPQRQSQKAKPIVPATASELEAILTRIWSELLELAEVGIDDNFFDLGGNSLLSLRLVSRLQKELDIALPVVKLFQYPTIRSLAKYLSQGERQDSQPKEERKKQKTEGIAVIGMAGRFPGAKNVEEFWQNLCNGVASSTFFSEAELDPSIDPDLRNNPNYVKAKGIIEDADKFDAAFFGINPREAEMMDPQQRVFLEVVWEALETAGCDPDRYDGSIGLYAGSSYNTYFNNNICGRREIIDRLGDFQTMLANDKDFLTTRAAYKLNFTGPSVNINTACSTSLVAIAYAFQGLIEGQCDLALAGGITITAPLHSGYLYQEGAMLSPDGYCRPFDANAQGTLFNNGAGVVVLKRLEDAIRDGDRIEAVIRGVGLNNDGSGKVSFTAPSVDGQAGAIATAQATAGFDPETITFIESHGTATPLGDPIEVAALTQVFRQQTEAKGFCAIGSVKSNVGHLVAAAGVTGLIKTVLALKHKQIPPTLHFQRPNPALDLENSPFYVNSDLIPWETDNLPRRAGVSSFGVGGTNAHVVLEEFVAPQTRESPEDKKPVLLLLSAKTATALDAATANLKQYLVQHPEVNLADVAYNLQTGRKAFKHRRSVVCRDRDDAIQALTSLTPLQVTTRLARTQQPEIIFMFPGQGSQYVNMGLNLYESEPLFRETIDRCASILEPHLGFDLRTFLYPQPGDEETAAAALRETRITQPAIFTIEYALAQLWLSWGIQPSGAIGHSIGEFTAACLAGVFSLEAGLMLIATRGRLMQDLPSGAMLSVRCGAERVEPRLTGQLALAAINGPSLCVVSGPDEEVKRLQQELEAEEIVCKYLHTSHAFHSPMMDPIVEPFADCCRRVEFSPPTFPFLSTVTAQWITPEEATDPQYWANHLRATVKFANGVKALWEEDPTRVLLEVGPRTTTATLARQQAQDVKKQTAIASLGKSAENQEEWMALLAAIGQLWLTGISLDWQQFQGDRLCDCLALPTYPFERQRFWIDPPNRVAPQPSQTPVSSNSYIGDNPMPTAQESRPVRLIPILQEVIEETSGIEVEGLDSDITFLEMGLDSLSLTQVGQALQKKFKVNVTFRQLLEEFINLDLLAAFLDRELPPDAFAPESPAPAAVAPPPVSPAVAQPVPIPTMQSLPTQPAVAPMVSPTNPSNVEALVNQQLQIMARQLELLGTGGVVPAPVPVAAPVPAPPPANSNGSPPPAAPPPTKVVETEEKPQKTFGAGARIAKTQDSSLSAEQQAYLDKVMERYLKRTGKSKEYTAVHRPHLADPRVVSGFNPLLKEIVYPIVVSRSSGCKLWDLDGNEYVDLTNGFGSNFFGYLPDFVRKAVDEQLDRGIEIGPQTDLVGDAAKMFCEVTNFDRAAFCNTGSEAVLGAMRVSRTVTGRDTIAMFSGAYHGILDEVIVRGTKKLKSLPAAPGIPREKVDNILVVDYGTPESLEILKERVGDLAAILVEPVQSRRPDLQPKEFLQELRRITEKAGTALIFDEIVTGFRIHQGGAQAHFGIQGDLGTYGKIVGGGMPIGVIAGKSRFMDALDGGLWQYGDGSIPEVGVTYFAGTFVRHPLAMAAVQAVLKYMKEQGPELQLNLNRKTDKFCSELNAYFEQVKAPLKMPNFGSLMKPKFLEDVPQGELLYYILREKGVHIWDARPCFFTLAHTDADIELVLNAFKESVWEMQMAGLMPGQPAKMNPAKRQAEPPVPGARLGRDAKGNPAWFVPDPDRPGKYLQVG
jgi:amino acid adenylation domain-containing protein